MNTKHDTVDVLLAIALEVTEAVLVLTVALVALALTVARAIRQRAAHPAVAGSPARVMTPPPAAAPAPAVHPLALVAEQLEALPVSALRPMVGTRSKRLRKDQLVVLAVAC
ncbi:hypothetical protein [Cyanobium sp. Lug-B]|uniref:hypothetical protein n=1 Tax=Cyanobium sp. Lug-B TaxID=2823716 RepID=UPI0020CCAB10|nr:hypothetical protein [Cyanobium sp. Lug-B]MCP9796101.1 hypothetical protein [Cyanobium sp. Lug-B]